MCVAFDDECLNTNSCTPLMGGLLTCILECVWTMGSQSQMCVSALSILRTMSVNMMSTEILGISGDATLSHLWEVMCGAAEGSESAYGHLAGRLSPLCVTYLWEGTSSLVSDM